MVLIYSNKDKLRFTDTVYVTNKIYGLFRKHKTLTASDIIHHYGYAKSTVYKAIEELFQQGIIKPAGHIFTEARGPRAVIYCDTQVLESYHTDRRCYQCKECGRRVD